MRPDASDHREKRSFITAQEVEDILASEPSTELPPVPPPALIPYALVHVAEDSADALRTTMDAILSTSAEFAANREAIITSLLFLTFPGRAEDIAARQSRCNQCVDRIRSELGCTCRIVTGSIRGHFGMLSERNGWFGLLCPHAERVFERLLSLPVGHVARLDLA